MTGDEPIDDDADEMADIDSGKVDPPETDNAKLIVGGEISDSVGRWIMAPMFKLGKWVLWTLVGFFAFFSVVGTILTPILGYSISEYTILIFVGGLASLPLGHLFKFFKLSKSMNTTLA